MSYKARIVPKAAQTIRGWGLARETVLEVLHRLLTDLPANPDQHLGEIIVPLNLRSYHFTLGTAPFRLVFMFAVERHDDTQELIIVGGRLTREDPSVE